MNTPARMQRLRQPAQFQAVMQGTVLYRTPHFVLHALQWRPASGTAPQGAQPCQRRLFADGAIAMGVLVPKRWAKRAVTRNLIKRQMRAITAELASELPLHTAIVLRLRAGFDRRQFISASSDALKQAVRAELQQLFARTDWRRLQPLAQPPAVPLAPSDALQHPSGTMQGTP